MEDNNEDSPIKNKINKNENNNINGGEALLGVLKDEEEKKEEEMEQKMREEKEFKRYENAELEEEDMKQEEDIIKDEIVKEEEKEELLRLQELKKEKKNHELILPNEVDESKKVFKLNNQNIKEIIIHNTKNNPKTRAYLSTEYSPKYKKIICIGGSDMNSEQYDKITLYDPINHKWIYYKDDFESFNIKLSGQSSNLININFSNAYGEKRTKEIIFLFGGYNNLFDDYTSHAFLIDTSDMSFEDISFNMNNEGKNICPSPRSYHTANYDQENQRIYIYGGTDLNINNSKKEDFQSLWEFSLEGQYWTKYDLKNCNKNGAPRGHTSILHNNKLYIFGGILLFKKFQNSLYTIDLEKKEIEIIEYNKDQNNVSPKPTAFHSAVKIDEEKFIIHGGLNENYNAINDCYLFYFKDNKFERVDIPFLPKLFGHKLNLDYEHGSIFIIGGMDSFKYIGDENLIFSDDEEEDEENDKIIKQENIEVITKPMEQIFEIVLKNFVCKEYKENIPEVKNKKRKVIKNLRWLKYII
jgi:hypothetical protein